MSRTQMKRCLVVNRRLARRIWRYLKEQNELSIQYHKNTQELKDRYEKHRFNSTYLR